MWLRISAHYKPHHMPVALAQHRKAEGTKTVSKPEAFAAEIIGALENFFSSPYLPAELKSIEPYAYAHAFLNHALLNFRLERIAEAHAALQSAFRYSPNLVSAQRERTIRAFVDFADSSCPLEDARKYLDLVFAQLPESARPLLRVRASVWRRVEILHAARSKDRRALRRARGLLLPTLIDDSAWMRNRAARGEMLKVLIGQRAIRRLAGFKHLLRTARSAFPRTRKNYA
jgi:tetratricopeptide (TPR) repeat protein